MLKSKKFLEDCHAWCNAAPRKLGWSLGDVAPWVNRVRMMLLHSRDAARDGKVPPDHRGYCKAVLNMISVNAITANDEKDDEIELPAKVMNTDTSDKIKRRRKP